MKNTIKTTLRHLWKHRLFTILNIIGLSIGISTCWLVFSIVHYEFSFDKKIPDLEQVYQIISGDALDSDEDFAGIPLGMPPLMAAESLDDALIVPIYKQYIDRLFVPQGSGKEDLIFEDPSQIVATLPTYFEMLPYEWLAGTAETAFSDPNQVVMTESTAQMYFPDAHPAQLIGRTLLADTVSLTVAGIVRDLPFPSSFHDGFFLPIRDQDWHQDTWHSMNSNHLLFVKTAHLASLNHLLDLAQQRYDDVAGKDHAAYGINTVFRAFPLSEKHFNPKIDTSGKAADKKVLYGLMAMGGFLLLLACINYVNISTAQVPRRAKEIGIRKTLGARPIYLTTNFLVETACITVLAVFFSWPWVLLFRKFFPEYTPSGMLEFEQAVYVILFLVFLVVSISLIAGLYPAYLINKVRTIDTLKGPFVPAIQGTRLTLRKSLIVFQFIIAHFFIVSTLIIEQQLHFTLSKDLGFEHEAIVTLNMPYKSYQNADVDPILFKRALQQYPETSMVAMGHLPQSNNHWGSAYYFTTDTGQVQLLTPRKYIDADFLDLYNIELLAGRNIHQTDTMRDVLINESALKLLGLDSAEEAIGKFLFPFQGASYSYPIVGVYKDFHQKPLHSEIEPLVLASSSRSVNLQSFHIRLPDDRSQWPNSFLRMESEWKRLYPNAPFTYHFVDENIKNLYENEHRTSRLIGLAAGVTILISCLGLFGLATLTAYQRVKEIGIRKVLGASVSGIARMLSKEFVTLVFIAIIIASPIAWWVMNKWLENFAYRVDVEWWMFMIAGAIGIGIALLTVSWQAVKVALANPVNSLRDE